MNRCEAVCMPLVPPLHEAVMIRALTWNAVLDISTGL
jgi:hypothetical protein